MLDLNTLSLPDLFNELTADGCMDRLLDAAFEEDARRPGDITTRSIVTNGTRVEAHIVARQPGVIAGLACAARVLGEDEDDGDTAFTALVHDGEGCEAGQVLAHLHDELSNILFIERILLNLIGRLSGVATMTRKYVDAIAGTGAVICDTRKTTPGMRNMEKYAVRCGGGTLHRLGLFDAALYKDNHLAGIPVNELKERVSIAARNIRNTHDVRFIGVEVDRLDQLKEVLGIERGLIDIVLLDNMKPEQLREAVAMRNTMARDVLLEASGGVNLTTVRAIAETGVNRISVGAVTHSAPCLDVALDIEP
jgi:nicotinate-nucleotide pyrophosphorylase (carboxylating)